MKNKTVTILLVIVTAASIITGIGLSVKSKILEASSIEIIDATYKCNNALEKFYEDNQYIYYFPCVKSNSIFVKFSNGNKILVTKALEEKKVTIDELIKAGLEVEKKEK